MSSTHDVQAKKAVSQVLAFAIGVAVGVLAWAEYSSPAIALALPLAWALAPTRFAAFFLTFGYHLAVMRFAPPYAAMWFDSLAAGVLAWLGQGVLSASAWALCWTHRRSHARVALHSLAALLITMLPPFALAFAGHPLMSLGYVIPGTGWIGVTVFFLVLPAFNAYVVCLRPAAVKVGFAQMFVLSAFASILWLGGTKLDSSDPLRGRLAGKTGAVHTEWGKFPNDDMEAIHRVEKIAKAVKSLAGGDDGFDTVIFPEAIIGVYEPGIHAVIESEVLSFTKTSGQTVVAGADVSIGPGTFQNVVVIFRPDGSSSHIAARQNAPVAAWAPWRDGMHFPSDWFQPSSAAIGDGVNARFMFCYEEYMPLLHLISEAQESSNLVVAVANRWAAQNALVSAVQSGHTAGMAMLFGKPWVRAENRPSARAE